MDVKKSLLRDLEEGFWITMKALADEAEERGEAWKAAGWRWMAERKKRPFKGKSGEFFWMKEDPSVYEYGIPAIVTSLSNKSISTLLENTAEELGEWLQFIS